MFMLHRFENVQNGMAHFPSAGVAVYVANSSINSNGIDACWKINHVNFSVISDWAWYLGLDIAV